MTRDHLSYLPNEILCLILDKLDSLSVIRCAQVSRKLDSVSKDSHLYEYHVKLVLANLEDRTSDPAVGTLARLKQLEKHQQAWSTSTWSYSETYDFSFSRAWELAGGVLGFCDNTNGFTFIRLPSLYREIEKEQRSFKVEEVGGTVEDFSFDPSQDLLVAVTRRVDSGRCWINVHLLTVDEGQPHPSASTPTFCAFEGAWNSDEGEYDIRIFNRRLGIMFMPDDDDDDPCRIGIWDWETGTLIRRLTGPVTFSFLTETLIVYSTRPDEDHPNTFGTLNVADLDREASTPLVLQLPHFPGLYELFIHSEIHSSHTRSARQRRVPFSVSEGDRLFVVGCRMWHGMRHIEAAIFIPLSTFLCHVDSARSNTRSITVLAWDSWGPDGSKIVPIEFPDIWVCYVQGLRAAFLNYSDSILKPGARYSIYDLNPLLGRRRGICQEVEKLRTDQDPEDNLPQTNIPCTVLTGQLPGPDTMPSGLMLSEDALLVVSEEETEITVYSF
ncbi:hypothetical protein V5O48_004279 [Marasmius crinis-equi]|uniref:F-box domain-containing protein n=1 Tax=Marasmius crinis-equi TaxID=585013 RepID=A0ABR3FRJ3_9AGAR